MLPPLREHTILDVASVLTRVQSFYRAMYSRPDLDLFNFALVHLFVSVSALRYPYMSWKITQVRIFRYYSKFFLDRKFKVITIPWMSLLTCGSSHQGHAGFSGHSRGKQWSFMRLSALLTTQTIPVIEWNSTTIDNALVQADNMYLNAFNNDLIFPRKGFLSLNNFPTVVKVVCCRQVLRLFVSTGL